MKENVTDDALLDISSLELPPHHFEVLVSYDWRRSNHPCWISSELSCSLLGPDDLQRQVFSIGDSIAVTELSLLPLRLKKMDDKTTFSSWLIMIIIMK